MELAEIKSWVENNPQASCNSLINAELMLIEYNEKQKHNHLSPEEVKKIWYERIHGTAGEVMATAMLKVYGRRHGISPNLQEHSSEFFKVYSMALRSGYQKFKQLSDLPELDENFCCGHDRELNERIAMSLEYITGLINKHK